MYTTLNAIRKHQPCKDGWKKLLKYLGKTKPDDEPLPLLTILESNGLDEALWCFRAVDGFEKEKLLLAITYAREVEHLMPAESKKSLDVFDRYANDLATQEEFEAACGAADAAWDTYAAAWDIYAAAAAYAARAAATWSATAAAAWSAAWAAAEAAHAAARATAAYSTIQAKQETQLRELLEKSCTQP